MRRGQRVGPACRPHALVGAWGRARASGPWVGATQTKRAGHSKGGPGPGSAELGAAVRGPAGPLGALGCAHPARIRKARERHWKARRAPRIGRGCGVACGGVPLPACSLRRVPAVGYAGITCNALVRSSQSSGPARPAALPTATGWDEELRARTAGVRLPRPGHYESSFRTDPSVCPIMLRHRYR